MTRSSGRTTTKAKAASSSSTTMDVVESPVIATEDRTDENVPSSSSSADNNENEIMASTNDKPTDDATAIDDIGAGTTDDGFDVAVTMINAEESNDDEVGGNSNNDNETSSADGINDGNDTNEATNNADITEKTVSEEDENEDVIAEEEEEKEELWDLKMVLSAKQILSPHPVICQTDGCNLVACCIWSSNLDPETPWYSCLDCQVEHFGGWPSTDEAEGGGGGGLPIKVLSDELREAMMEKCTNLVEPELPNLPSVIGGEVRGTKASEKAGSDDANDSPSNENDGDEDDYGEVLWELKKVFSVKELTKTKPMRCKTDDCNLLACSVWKSSEGASWYSCLDCQENDYGGWPEANELPIDHLTEENRRLIAEKCSEQDNPTLPILPTSMSLLSTADAAGSNKGTSITPPPGHDKAVAESQSNIVVGAVHSKGGKKMQGGVTPSPMPPSSKKTEDDKPKVMSKSAIEAHRKWQAEAEKLGGPNARVVVSKPEAKKLIFDKLHNEFAPLNIDGVYKMLKAVVPSVVLKSCLDEMVDKHLGGDQFAEDSDDDDDDGKSSKKKAKTVKKSTGDSDEYAGSLRLKEGRNVNNNLYYVDHTKLSNEGNGLLPELRNELLCNSQKSKAELDQLNEQFKSITAEAAKLESEPKNEELILELADQESNLQELNDKLEESRAHASNEKHVKKVRSEIENMAAVWRKRKRQCIEFISMMEESTEGTISLKKCLKGEGALEIDSDEAAIKGAIAFAQRKRPNVSRGSLSGGGKNGDEGLRPDDNFIGVTLSALGKPERVFVTDN